VEDLLVEAYVIAILDRMASTPREVHCEYRAQRLSVGQFEVDNQLLTRAAPQFLWSSDLANAEACPDKSLFRGPAGVREVRLNVEGEK
jgi:hypothetical protein